MERQANRILQSGETIRRYWETLQNKNYKLLLQPRITLKKQKKKCNYSMTFRITLHYFGTTA